MCYGEYRGKRELSLFLRYVEARARKEYRDEAYRIYISESLRLAPQNKMLKMSYSDLVRGKKEKTEKRTGKEVAEAAAQKMGVKINWGGEQ